MQWVPGHSQG